MIYTHFISGRNITIIFRLANDHFKKDNDDIMGNTVIAPIGDGLNNICAGRFLGWRHEGKTQFRIMPHGCTLPSPMGETICSSVWLLVFVTGDLAFYGILLGNEGSLPHWCFYCMLAPAEWRDQDHLMRIK